MDLIARKFLFAPMLALFSVSPSFAQFGEEVPHAPYYAAVQAFYMGEYREAERELGREAQRGVRTPQAQWIDAICYHGMLGEVLYHQGRNADALAEFDQACQLILAYPNWLLQVRFQQPPRADANRVRRIPPWGQSGRTFVIGQISEVEPVLVGDMDAGRTAQTGGVVRPPMYWRVNVVEVMRVAALAIRRRNELLGPLAPQDPISRELSTTLARGNLAPANHWSHAWIDLLRGLAQVGMGKLDEADMLIGRSLVLDGQFDHKLTCVGLYEQGRVAALRGDTRRAGQLFAEAGFSAYYFENWDVLTESTLAGWLNHLTTGGAGVYPPLDPIAAWAQLNRLQHIATKLRLAQAESLLWQGEVAGGAGFVEEAGRRIGEMRGGLPNVHLLYLQAVVQLLQGQIEPGGELLTRALAAQAGVSLRNFQLARTNQMYDTRAASARVAVDFYAALLADPIPAEWLANPLDAMAVLKTAHDPAFDRWFLAALERKELPLALSIAERAKRRRYLASRPFGGRLLSLRGILETPIAELSPQAVLERQQILTNFPDYKALMEEGLLKYHELRAGPILANNPAEAKTIGPLFDAWDRNAQQRRQLLAQLAVRRLPASTEFPPFRTTPELQQSFGEGEALVVFHTAANNLYGFLVTQTDVHLWQLPGAQRLRTSLGNFLKALGNYGASRDLSVAELQSDAWRDAAREAYAAALGGARLDIAKTKALIIVPDDSLWYLPFEALIPGDAKAEKPLADHFQIRYGPTAALAITNQRPLRRLQHTGIVASDLKFAGDETAQSAMLQELAGAVSGPLTLPEALPQPAQLLVALLDELIVFDDLAASSDLGEVATLIPRARGSAKDASNAWIALPHTGPEQIALAGLSTEAEQGLKAPKRSTSRSTTARASARSTGAPGDELFQSLCNMMAGGARTVLATRWRTGGRTNFDLVREYAKELPNVPAAEAWQRACLLAREAPLDPTREPRLKRSDDTADMPTADHPFFWSGYLLVDTGPRPEPPAEVEPAKDDAKPDTEKGKALPPPAKQGEAAGDAPPVEPAKGAAATDEKSNDEVAKDVGKSE